MKYISILGKGYKDCKAKHDSIEKEPGVNYGFVTKLKHTAGIPISGVIETSLAKLNPEYKEIMAAVGGKRIRSKPLLPPVTVPVIEVPEPEPVAGPEVGLLDPEEVDDVKDFMDEVKESGVLEAMAEKHEEKEEEVVEEIPEEVPEEVVEEPVVEEVPEEVPQPVVEEVVEEPVVEEVVEVPEEVVEEPVVEEVVEEPVVEVVEEPVVEEVPEDFEPPKPVNPPRGWHARKEFIDSEGNIFNKGQYVGHVQA